MNGELKNQTAVVTGSSRGIGRAIALRLASTGANVVVHANRSTAMANGVAEEIRAAGGEATVCKCDLRDESAIEPFVADTQSWRGKVDIWVNNAGFDALTGGASNLSFEAKLQQLWQTDVRGTILCSRIVGQMMKAAGSGSIVNVGWDQAWQGMEGDSGEMFAASKGAIMAFTKSLAKSLAPNVRVNCVAPGWIKTEWGDEHASEYWDRRAIGESLRSRWGTPQDVANAVYFLASPAADFVTGHVLPVNGGFRSAATRDDGKSV